MLFNFGIQALIRQVLKHCLSDKAKVHEACDLNVHLLSVRCTPGQNYKRDARSRDGGQLAGAEGAERYFASGMEMEPMLPVAGSRITTQSCAAPG